MMNHEVKRGRTKGAWALATYAAIMAGVLAAVASQSGCSMVSGAVGGGLHGAAKDWDNLTDRMAEQKNMRQRNRYE